MNKIHPFLQAFRVSRRAIESSTKSSLPWVMTSCHQTSRATNGTIS